VAEVVAPKLPQDYKSWLNASEEEERQIMRYVYTRYYKIKAKEKKDKS
jgi:hypothetical protein